jgi:hypothetical protein
MTCCQAVTVQCTAGRTFIFSQCSSMSPSSTQLSSIGVSCKTTWSILGCSNQETVTCFSNLVDNTQHVTVLRSDLYCVGGAQLSTYSKMFVPCTPTETVSALKNCVKYLPDDHSRLGRHLSTFYKYSYECICNYQYGQVSATVCSKNIVLCSLFFSCKQSFWQYCRSGLGILKNWCRKMTLWGTLHPIWWCIDYVGDFSGPEEINGNCGKVTCAWMMHRGCTVIKYRL